jgi:hypothetical protein
LSYFSWNERLTFTPAPQPMDGYGGGYGGGEQGGGFAGGGFVQQRRVAASPAFCRRPC